MARAQTTLALRTSGGLVELVWDKGMMEGVEIQVDRGSGSFAFLALDTRPNHIDTAPIRSPAATWRNRAIDCKDAQRLGQWSNVAEITVGR